MARLLDADVTYLLDTDVFIGAKNLHYGFELCPGFWEWLAKSHAAGKVFSVEKVGAELLAGDDELPQWARERGPAFFRTPQEEDNHSLAAVSAWVNDNYNTSATALFFSGADYYLVAQAHAGGHKVVTHELSAPKSQQVKIPDVCAGMGIECLTPFEMLKREGARFVLERRAVGSGGAARVGR